MTNKDKVINELLGRIANLEREVERLHSIIKEVREYIEKEYRFIDMNTGEKTYTKGGEDILEILDKEKE